MLLIQDIKLNSCSVKKHFYHKYIVTDILQLLLLLSVSVLLALLSTVTPGSTIITRRQSLDNCSRSGWMPLCCHPTKCVKALDITQKQLQQEAKDVLPNTTAYKLPNGLKNAICCPW